MSTTSSSDILCAKIARRLADAVGSKRYSMWFDRSAKLDYRDEDRCLQVDVPNRFVAEWIGSHFDAELRTAADAEVGVGVELQVRISPERFTDAAPRPEPTPAADAPARKVKRRGSTVTGLKHRLDDFIVGASNQLAFSAAQGILSDEGDRMSPLFLHGSCGLGKTHLLQGICREMIRRRPDAAVLYLTAEQFTNEFLEAVRSAALPAFRRRIRKLDLLAVDDVRFLADKRATQREFLHSFDTIELDGAKVVLASDCHPRLIKQFSEALVSRCIRGMVVQIDPPDAATRLRIVQALAQRRGLLINDSVARFIAERCTDSVRQVEGVLTKVHALASLTQGQSMRTGAGGAIEVGHALVDHLFNSDLAQAPRRAVEFATILATVGTELGVTRAQILGSGRHRHVVLARAMVIYLARQMTPLSYPEIAAAMGRPSHSTVITACQRLEKQIAEAREVNLTHLGEQTTLDELAGRLKHAVARAARQ